MQTFSVHLPSQIYKRFQQLAQRKQRSVDDEVIAALENVLGTDELAQIPPEMMEELDQLAFLDNEHFATLWSYAGSHRRRFLLALCNLEEKERDPLRLGELSELLAGHGIEVSDDIIIADLEFLRELELIDFVSLGGEGRYRLTIPLMGQWIEAQQDFDALRTQARYETEDEHA